LIKIKREKRKERAEKEKAKEFSYIKITTCEGGFGLGETVGL